MEHKLLCFIVFTTEIIAIVTGWMYDQLFFIVLSYMLIKIEDWLVFGVG